MKVHGYRAPRLRIVNCHVVAVDRALTLTPSFSRGWFVSGILRNWAGQHDLAIEHAETSMRLSPRERRGTTLSLIAGLAQGSRLYTLVASVVALCRELGALVVAEGIETVEELRTVRACGAPLAQGYLLARPEFPPPVALWDDEWLAYVARRSRRPVQRLARRLLIRS